MRCLCGREAIYDDLICARCMWLDGGAKVPSIIISTLRTYSPLSLKEIASEIKISTRHTLKNLRKLELIGRIDKWWIDNTREPEPKRVYAKGRNAYNSVQRNGSGWWGYYLTDKGMRCG